MAGSRLLNRPQNKAPVLKSSPMRINIRFSYASPSFGMPWILVPFVPYKKVAGSFSMAKYLPIMLSLRIRLGLRDLRSC